MKIFSVIGISKSGKTTTIENILRALKDKGYSVGSIKEIHNEQFRIDVDGTNTDRHKKAGSELVTARGLFETDILYGEKLDIDEILCHYDYDFVVLEGVYDANVPNIITAHTTKEIDERLNDKTFLISGRISADITSYKGINSINSITDLALLIEEIEKNAIEYSINLPYIVKVEGKTIALNSSQELLISKLINSFENFKTLSIEAKSD